MCVAIDNHVTLGKASKKIGPGIETDAYVIGIWLASRLVIPENPEI